MGGLAAAAPCPVPSAHDVTPAGHPSPGVQRNKEEGLRLRVWTPGACSQRASGASGSRLGVGGGGERAVRSLRGLWLT